MIAHRLTTIQNCDTIVVIDNGSKVEEGSHKNLMKIPVVKDDDGTMASGWYHDLWLTQMGKESKETKELAVLQNWVKHLESMLDLRKEHDNLDLPSKNTFMERCISLP